MAFRSFTDPDTHFEIVESTTPVSVDGYAQGEPKQLRCPDCGVAVELTRDPSDPGIDDLPHETDCPQRGVHSRWYACKFFGLEAVQ